MNHNVSCCVCIVYLGPSNTAGTSSVTQTCNTNINTSDNTARHQITYIKPNQPATNVDIPHQLLTKTHKRDEKKLSFQVSWFNKFNWLHYCPDLKGVLCFYCMTASEKDVLSLVAKRDDAFCSVGFSNWKNAIERFKIHELHELSAAHAHAFSQLQQMKAMPVDVQLSAQKANEQASSRVALMALFSTIQFLARQGIALRGHDSHDGNYWQLLQLRSHEIPELKTWLTKTTNFISPESQNEMLIMLSHAILRNVINQIKHESSQFAVIVDGTQDVIGKEQESICLRHVDKNLDVHETFVGLYEPTSTMGPH